MEQPLIAIVDDDQSVRDATERLMRSAGFSVETFSRGADFLSSISAVSAGPAGAVRIRMHNKLSALVVLGKYLGMFDERPQNSNVIFAISDEPMSAEEWKKQYVTDR
jgi:DNA-binding NtrC family response regulator